MYWMNHCLLRAVVKATAESVLTNYAKTPALIVVIP